VQYLKPILRNEKEKSDYAVFKLYRTNTSETLEILFLDSCYKNLLKFLFYISNFHWKNDNSDKELLKILEKKLTTCRAAILELDDFLNNKIYNSTPEQKYGLTNSYR
jgi:inositol 1,4,5-triphosphate receptor type 1/inositol 1,4,5-triphosphate receptor type 3